MMSKQCHIDVDVTLFSGCVPAGYMYMYAIIIAQNKLKK